MGFYCLIVVLVTSARSPRVLAGYLLGQSDQSIGVYLVWMDELKKIELK